MPTATKKSTTKAAPAAKKTTTKAAPEAPAAEVTEVVFGVADLAKMLSEGREKPVTTRELRTLIRKMARDGQGRVQREIIAGNRSRYSWSGPEDPEVVAIIDAFNGGELEADKKEKLDALKARKAEQRAAKQAEEAKAAKKGKKAKATKVVEEDDEELELDDEE